ncbi:lysis protein [Providencia stuartii]|uniref:lysis protein n=1 Tax=Providencia stuartii TaxID=588 RepID=UPI00076B2502|nr:lysis protein [Providencia stuartii]AMG66633.1 lysis protein [Providencia stuartii]MBG5896821.1 lysis protein [Providencia stuartii]
MNSLKSWLPVLLWGGLCIALFFSTKEMIELGKENEGLKKENSSLIAGMADYEKRINSLHELDTKHTTELTNAKAEIDKLRDAVRSGRKRVYINAECPSTEKSPTSSVDASRSATLARDAEQDYFDLLKQLETLEKQYLGLRDYYYSECSNDSLSI